MLISTWLVCAFLQNTHTYVCTYTGAFHAFVMVHANPCIRNSAHVLLWDKLFFSFEHIWGIEYKPLFRIKLVSHCIAD